MHNKQRPSDRSRTDEVLSARRESSFTRNDRANRIYCRVLVGDEPLPTLRTCRSHPGRALSPPPMNRRLRFYPGDEKLPPGCRRGGPALTPHHQQTNKQLKQRRGQRRYEELLPSLTIECTGMRSQDPPRLNQHRSNRLQPNVNARTDSCGFCKSTHR